MKPKDQAPKDDAKDTAYEQLARIGKAMAGPGRLKILDILRNGARTVESLAEEAGMGVANVSRHLQVLRGAGMVDSEKTGLYVTYRVADAHVCEFFSAMCRLAEARLAEFEKIISRFADGSEAMEPVDRADLVNRLENDEIIVIDVRPESEYRAGHIPGALSIPAEEMASRLAELPPEKEIVAYCRGPYCLLASRAVEVLREHGYSARRMREGIPEWRAFGMPVSSGGHQHETL